MKIAIERRVVTETNATCALIYACISNKVEEKGNPALLSTHDIHREVGCLSKRTIYRAIDKLCEKGFLTKEPLKSDCRAWYTLVK